MLATNNVFAGSDNTFANGTINTTGNIERLDFPGTVQLPSRML
jgi:hypothetical protein